MSHAAISQVKFRIAALPDLGSIPHLVSREPAEQVWEALARQTVFVAQFWRWQNQAAIALQWHYSPATKATEFWVIATSFKHLLGRGPAVDDLRKSVRAMFAAASVDLVDVADDGAHLGFTNRHPACEVCVIGQVAQRLCLGTGSESEEAAGADASYYIVQPFPGPRTTLIGVLEALRHQEAEVLVNVHLQPTHLEPAEQQHLLRLAADAGSLSSYTQERSRSGPIRVNNPVLARLSDLYSSLSDRLLHCGLMVIQVASPSAAAAEAVASRFGAELVPAAGQGTAGATEAAATYALHRVEDELERSIWMEVLETGYFDPRRLPEAQSLPAEEQRLRFLMDATSASSAFRLPIPIREAVPGVRTKLPLPPRNMPAAAPSGVAQVIVGKAVDSGLEAGIPLDDLTSHTLVAGATGSGKTSCILALLDQLSRRGIPFLIIEPANKQYRRLLRSNVEWGKKLRVFTLGDESTRPFRFNPFQVLPGVALESHLGSLKSCFNAALPAFGPLPQLVQAALAKIYTDNGWSELQRGQNPPPRPVPTMAQFVACVKQLLKAAKYSSGVEADLGGAIGLRLQPLLSGNVGKMLNSTETLSVEDLLSAPTVLELDAVPDAEQQQIIMLFLLTFLQEHCRTSRNSLKCQHVTVIEEAHRLMGRAKGAVNRETQADSQAAVAGLFSHALSELRTFGEGLVVVDQVPTRLVEDCLKNTASKVVFRLPGIDDCSVTGNTMNMNPEEARFLATLPRFQAAFFGQGSLRPAFLVVENFGDCHKLPERLGDTELRTIYGISEEPVLEEPLSRPEPAKEAAEAHGQTEESRFASIPPPTPPPADGSARPFAGCGLCQNACKHWADGRKILESGDVLVKFQTECGYIMADVRGLNGEFTESEMATKKGASAGYFAELVAGGAKAENLGHTPGNLFCGLCHLANASKLDESAELFQLARARLLSKVAVQKTAAAPPQTQS